MIIPDDVDHYSKISEAQILNVDSKIPEFFQKFLSEESFGETGKNILKFTNLFEKFMIEKYYYKSSKENTTRKSKNYESKW